MDAEIQFFMTSKDETEFLAFVKKHVDSIENYHDSLSFILGDCELTHTPSVMEDNILYMGSLEIRLGKVVFKDQERAKSTFRKLRNWLKKNYFSRLAYLNKKNKLTPSRVHWLGTDAKKWKIANVENHILKLSRTSWMEFDIGF